LGIDDWQDRVMIIVLQKIPEHIRVLSSCCCPGNKMMYLDNSWKHIVYPVWLAAVPEGKLELFIYIQATGKMGELVVINLRKTDEDIRIAAPSRKTLIFPSRSSERRKQEMEKEKAGEKAKLRTKRKYAGNVYIPASNATLLSDLNCCIFFTLRSVK
jgi:Tfp pilus assembly protein PilZ